MQTCGFLLCEYFIWEIHFYFLPFQFVKMFPIKYSCYITSQVGMDLYCVQNNVITRCPMESIYIILLLLWYILWFAIKWFFDYLNIFNYCNIFNYIDTFLIIETFSSTIENFLWIGMLLIIGFAIFYLQKNIK